MKAWMRSSFLAVGTITIMLNGCSKAGNSSKSSAAVKDPTIGSCKIIATSGDLGIDVECSDKKTYQLMTVAMKGYVPGTKVFCFVTEQMNGDNYWVCDNGAFEFVANAPVVASARPVPSPAVSRAPAATTAASPVARPTTASPAATAPQGTAALGDPTKATPVTPPVAGPNCAAANRDALTCRDISLAEGASGSIWGQQWKCSNGCAVWLGSADHVDACRQYNQDGLTCAPLNIGEGQYTCQWGQNWQCVNGCAKRINSCGVPDLSWIFNW